MKRSLHPLLYLVIVCCASAACSKKTDNNPTVTDTLKDYNKDITVVNWNIEWFGSATRFEGDLNIQQANAGKVLQYLNADLYGLCEITDTARLGTMVRDRLGNDFRYVISDYPVGADAQKMAFVYNRHIFRNVQTRPFLGLSSTAYASFAGGRFPYLFTADIVVNGGSRPACFILMHAKANADIIDYNRRKAGSAELKDSLDLYFKGNNIVLFGDYNDHLNGSILAGYPSPYMNFVNDTTHYSAITYPLNVPGYTSTISYAHSVIDQQVISRGMVNWYLAGSVKIRTDIVAVVPDYNTGNTSDHYPVSSVFRF